MVNIFKTDPILKTALPVAASEGVIERAADALRANNIEVVIVDTGAEARDEVLSRIAPGSEVYKRQEQEVFFYTGVFAALHAPGAFDAVRPRLMAMDRATQGREMRKLGASAGHDRRQRERHHE